MLSKRYRNQGQVLSLPLSLLLMGTLAVGLLLAPAVIAGLESVGTVNAQSPQGAYGEAEAQAIDRMLMCPVCPAESIDQAQVPLAKQMRARVREMLSEGASRQEILAYFADRYGQNVLASPPKTGLNLLAWILPLVGVLAAMAVGLFVLRAMTGKSDGSREAVTGSGGEDPELEPYLAAVDRFLVIDDDSSEKGRDEDDGDTR